MKVTYLIVGLSLVTLGQAIRCYQCSGTNGLCSSEADNGSGSSCYNSGEICWFEHDTSDGQDRYYRKCGKGLETGCFVENTENGVSNITNLKIAKYIISFSRDYIQFVYVIRIIATKMMIVIFVME